MPADILKVMDVGAWRERKRVMGSWRVKNEKIGGKNYLKKNYFQEFKEIKPKNLQLLFPITE